MAENQESKIEINAYEGAQVNIASDNGNINATQCNMHQKTKIQSNIITYGQDIMYTNNFVGREGEINEIIEKLKKNNRVLISGMGGIGKTTILKKIYHIVVEEYRNTNKKIGYFEYELSMDDTIYNALEFEKTGDRNIDVQKAKRILEDYANSGEVTILIDNIPTEKYNELQQLGSIRGKIIITSRQNEYENYETVFIDKMSAEDCKKIFEKESGISEAPMELDYIINECIGRHTLTVKILAKIAKKKQWTIRELRNKLLDVGFKIEYRNSGETTNILTEYKKLYSITELNENEKNILEGFSLLREAKLDKNMYQMFLAQDAEDIENDELFELYEKGWLERDGDKFSIHPVFAEFISELEEIDICKHGKMYNVIISLCSFLDDSVISSRQAYLTELISFGKNVPINTELGNVLFCIASIARDFAEYNGAIDILKRIGKDNIQTYIKTQLTLADLYLRMSNFERTRECLEGLSPFFKKKIDKIWYEDLYIEYKIHYALFLDKSSKTKSDVIEAIHEIEAFLDVGKKDVIKAKIYNCLGGFYSNLNRDCDDLDKALNYNKMALNIREKNDAGIMDLARTYNNIGRVYYYKSIYKDKGENLDRAEDYLIKSLKLREKIYSNNHPDIARVLGNLGNVYLEQGKCVEALFNIKKALDIRVEILGKNTWEVCLTYSNLVRVYVELGDKKSACIARNEAEKICLLLYGSASERYRNMCNKHKKILMRIT